MRITPINPLVAELADVLGGEHRELFEERAGIVEFDGALPREYAECLSLLGVLKHDPFAFTGVVVLQAERHTQSRFLLTTCDRETRQRLARQGFVVSAARNLASVLAQQFGGRAELRRNEHLI